MNQIASIEFDLYFDESGTFRETSTDKTERDCAKRASKNEVSQLAGILAPVGYLTRNVAEEILVPSLSGADIEFNDEIHATEISNHQKYNKLISGLIENITSRKLIQPVRIVNLEQVSYGERVANYTNIVAELLIRIFQEKQKQVGNAEIIINLYPAAVKLGEYEDGSPILMDERDYKIRITEYLAFHSVRKGYAIEASKWKLGSFKFRSGKRDRCLQICDLISNSSYRGFSRCDEEIKNAGSNMKCNA